MPRLFVALPVPPACAERLLELRTGLLGVRWMSAESLHLTLRFLGAVDSRCFSEVEEALRDVRQPPVPVRCLGLDVYGGANRQPRSIARNVETHGRLVDLYRAVERALRPLVPPGRRRFRPHVTLARIRRSARPPKLHYCLEDSGLPDPVTWMADTFSLYSSHLGREAAVYTAEAIYPLEG